MFTSPIFEDVDDCPWLFADLLTKAYACLILGYFYCSREKQFPIRSRNNCSVGKD